MNASGQQNSVVNNSKVAAPPTGFLYHGVHIGGDNGEEDIIRTQPERIANYIKTVGETNKPFFIYFSQEWRKNDLQSRRFPLETINKITESGAIPFIRLMLRSSDDSATDYDEDLFKMKNILKWEKKKPRCTAPEKDSERIFCDLIKWGEDARTYGKPLIVEWGTEVNDNTFHWNGAHNGKNMEAAHLFRRTYRHIVKTISGNEPENSNITWVFHVVPESTSSGEWDQMASYFPDGRPEEDPKNYVDWIGVSIYGVQNLATNSCESFQQQFNNAYNGNSGLEALSEKGISSNNKRPVFILEFGSPNNYQPNDLTNQCHSATWTQRAFETMFDFARLGKIAGFSWWSERYPDESTENEKKENKFKYLEMQVPVMSGELKTQYVNGISNRQVIHGRVKNINP